jgi:hypothetical protein
MPKNTTVTFRGKQMRVTYDPSPRTSSRLDPSAEVEWWFADLTAVNARSYTSPHGKKSLSLGKYAAGISRGAL